MQRGDLARRRERRSGPWGLKLPVTRLRQPDGLALLEAHGVPEVWCRSVAEALAVIDWLDEALGGA